MTYPRTHVCWQWYVFIVASYGGTYIGQVNTKDIDREKLRHMKEGHVGIADNFPQLLHPGSTLDMVFFGEIGRLIV